LLEILEGEYLRRKYQKSLKDFISLINQEVVRGMVWDFLLLKSLQKVLDLIL